MSDTTSRGIQYPTSGDIVRTGVAGEAKLAQDLQVLATTTNTAIDEVDGRVDRRLIASTGSLSTEDLDDRVKPQLSSYSAAAPNAPSNKSGMVFVGYVSSSTNAYIQVAFEYGADPTIWQRSRFSGGWGTWEPYRPDVWWKGAAQLPEATDFTTLAPGEYSVWSGTRADDLGLPTRELGIVHLVRFGSSNRTFLRWTDAKGSMWVTSFRPADPIEWVEIGAGHSAPVVIDGAGISPGMRTVPLSLTAGNSGDTVGPSSGAVTYPMGWAAPIIRWRVFIKDGNPRHGTSGTGTISVTNLRADGIQVVSSASFPAGEGWHSPWVEGQPKGDLAFSYTSTNPPILQVGGGTLDEASRTTMPFEMWVEAETMASTPVISTLGDSNSVGVGTDSPLQDSWLSQYCRRVGALPVHYGASGDGYIGWQDPDHYKWNRWQHLDRPDAIIHALGSNDMVPSGGLSGMQDRALPVWEIAAEKISHIQHAVTIKPRTNWTPEYQSTRHAFNSWLQSQPGVLRHVHDGVSAVSSDDTVMLPQYDADGLHLNTAGHQALADSISAPVAVSSASVVSPDGGIHTITVDNDGTLSTRKIV